MTALVALIALALAIYAIALARAATAGLEKDELRRLRFQMAELTRRVWELERESGRSAPAREAPPVAAPLAQTPEPAAPMEAPAAHALEPPSALPEPGPMPEPAIRRHAGPGWELLVGGNLLNKLGVLILVIGLTLAAGYTFSSLGPWGKIGLSIFLGAGMIAGGMALETREQYTMFGRGLLGGGWSILYLTAYASHGIAASRVVDNPVIAGVFLLAVATGMIGHSLRYRSETVTGLAFFLAYAALGLTEAHTFSLAASVPLAAALGWLASRFQWRAMMTGGAAASYLTFLVVGLQVESQNPGPAQAVLLVYWLLFTLFDLQLLRHDGPGGFTGVLFWVNAVGGVALSAATWREVGGGPLRWVWLGAAVLYVADGVLRAIVRPGAGDAPFGNASRGGAYPSSVLAATGLLAAWLESVTRGLAVNLWWLAEGEALWLAGWRFGLPYLRLVALIPFGLSIQRLFFESARQPGAFTVAGYEFDHWAMIAAVTALLFYGNRAINRTEGWYGYLAAALLTVTLLAETPAAWATAAVFAFGWLLLELSAWRAMEDLLWQGMGVALLAAVPVALWALVATLGGSHGAAAGATAILLYAGLLRFRFLRFGPPGIQLFRQILSWTAILFAMSAPPVLDSGWAMLLWVAIGAAVILVEGLFAVPGMIWQGAGVAAASAAGSLFLRWSTTRVPSPEWLGPIAIVAGLSVAAWGAARRTGGRVAAGMLAVLAGLRLAWLLADRLSNSVLSIAWGLEAVGLLLIGFFLAERGLRYLGLGLFAICVSKLFFFDLSYLSTPYRILSFIVLGCLLIAVSWLYSRYREQFNRVL